jgi:glucan phosphoethanolaminetransferase (alkaline phosphatase superfamily)
MDLKEQVKKIYHSHVPLKHIIAAIIVLLIVLYFFKEKVLFEDLLKILVPFLIGTSVKVAMYVTKNILV